MSGMTTFNDNDSISSHGEESISLLNRIAEITKEAYKYLPEKDCTLECGVFVDVDSRAFLHAIQHIRESIEAYRDLTEELDEDISKLRKMCEAFAGKCPYRDKYCGGDFEDCVECDYAKKLVVNKDAERLFEQLQEDCEHFRNLAISRNEELEQEREQSTQLEQRIKVLTAERDLAKKLAKQKAEELKRQLNEKYGATVDCMEVKAKLDKKCREVGELTKELEYEHEQAEFWRKKYMSLREVKEQSPAYWKEQFERMQKKSTQLEQRCSELVIDRDKAVEYWTKYCESLLQKHREELAAKDREIYKLNKQGLSSLYGKANDPCNFCGNCRHYAQMGKDDGDFEGICTQHYVKRVDPDDASCEHFKTTYDKPDHEVCDNCDSDCDTCGYYPF